MSAKDALDRGEAVDVHPVVRNIIIVAVGVPPILVLWAVGIAAIGVAYRVVETGTLPDGVGALPAIAQSDIAALAVAGAVAYLYLIWANVVFGESAVESGIEQAGELQERAEEARSDGGTTDAETDESNE
jgi:multisubunit Na+/H+ antiporter MnhF subunit